MLMSEPDNMKNWVEQRTKFMPLRTVQTKTPARKRPIETANGSKCATDSRPGRSSRQKISQTPTAKKVAQSTTKKVAQSTTKKVAQSTNVRLEQSTPQQHGRVTRSSKRKAEGQSIKSMKPSKEQKRNLPRKKVEAESSVHSFSPSTAKKGTAVSGKRESAALPPFGRILSSTTPDDKENLNAA
jgi:flagellar motor protein MotB